MNCFILLIFIFYFQGAQSANLDCVHPKTVLVLLNDTATIFCSDITQIPLTAVLLINGNFVDSSSTLEGITWEDITANNSNSVIGFTVNVTATHQTNLTSVQCILQSCARTDIGYVIVVESK